MGEPAKDDGPLALAALLTALAGFVDASAFMRFNGLFVSFASGNSTRLAALPSEGRVQAAAIAAGAVALFVMGAFAGRLIGLAAGGRKAAALLGSVALLLALAAVAGLRSDPTAAALGVAAMALAMGVQNSVLHRADGVHATLSYVTGTLVNLGHELADAVTGQPSHWGASLLMWLGMVAGAGVGAVTTERLGSVALWLPAAAAGLLAIVLSVSVKRGPPTGSPP